MNFNLQPNEVVLLQSINVKRVGATDSCDELILTNLNIIYVDRGWITKKIKNVIYFPLNQIKRADEKPQVSLGLNGKNGTPQLQVYFIDGVESFEFISRPKREINKWIKAINFVFKGFEASERSNAIPGVKKITETIRDTFGVIADTISENHRKKQIITTKCIGCQATLTGQKNELIKCKYCDTIQKIKKWGK